MNIMRIKQVRCQAKFPQKGRGKRPIIKQGTVVGAYANQHWYPHMYHSYHIEFDDGTKTTLCWEQVELLR